MSDIPTDVTLCVPFQTRDIDRIRAWDWIFRRYEQHFPGWYIKIGNCPVGEPWSRPVALRHAVSQAETEFIVIAEPDSWSDAIGATVSVVAEGHPWAVSHSQVYRINHEGTQWVLDDDRTLLGHMRSFATDLPLLEPPYFLVPGGTGIAMRRSLFLECPPDVRFKGWGGEDEAWGDCLRTLYGNELRATASLFHLYHTPNRAGGHWMVSKETAELTARYKDAVNSETRMRHLIAEHIGLM